MDPIKSPKQENHSATAEKCSEVPIVLWKRRASKATSTNSDMTTTGIKKEGIISRGRLLRLSWNEEQNQQLIRWYFDGLNDNEIAQRFGDRSNHNVKTQRLVLTGQRLGKDLSVHPLYMELMGASRTV